MRAARDALDSGVLRVLAAGLADVPVGQGTSVYAVFPDEASRAEGRNLCGLVTERRRASAVRRSFGDLVRAARHPPPVLPDAPLTEVGERLLAEGAEALAVVGEGGVFLGTVTPESLLSFLLRGGAPPSDSGAVPLERHDLLAWAQQLEALHASSTALFGTVQEVNRESDVLQEATRILMALAEARYAAIGLIDAEGRLSGFYHAGVSRADAERIGALPEGRGLLGVVVRQKTVLNVADTARDPRSAGFPPHHPPMTTLLAAPIVYAGEVFGRVYVSEKTVGGPFVPKDERLVAAFADVLAVALVVARSRVERATALKDLHRSEALLAAAQRIARIGSWEYDVAAGDLLLSAESCRLLGVAADSPTRLKAALGRVHPDDRRLLRGPLQDALLRGESYGVDCRFLLPDGSVAYRRLETKPLLDETGRAVRFVGTIQDIDERKQTEIALVRAREAAMTADRVRGEFVANVSHELRTPLNVILGMTELALDTELTGEQQEFIDAIRSAGIALLSLVDDILNFAKIEAGKFQLDDGAFSLRERLAGCLGAFAHRTDQRGIELVCEVAPDVPDGLVGDPKRLGQILSNLLDNSAKFTHAGEIVLEAGVERQSADEVWLRFSVADTGIGIPPEKHAAIFESSRRTVRRRVDMAARASVSRSSPRSSR